MDYSDHCHFDVDHAMGMVVQAAAELLHVHRFHRHWHYLRHYLKLHPCGYCVSLKSQVELDNLGEQQAGVVMGIMGENEFDVQYLLFPQPSSVLEFE